MTEIENEVAEATDEAQDIVDEAPAEPAVEETPVEVTSEPEASEPRPSGSKVRNLSVNKGGSTYIPK